MNVKVFWRCRTLQKFGDFNRFKDYDTLNLWNSIDVRNNINFMISNNFQYYAFCMCNKKKLKYFFRKEINCTINSCPKNYFIILKREYWNIFLYAECYKLSIEENISVLSNLFLVINIVCNIISISETDFASVNNRLWKGRVRCSNVIFMVKIVSSHKQSRTLRNAINK